MKIISTTYEGPKADVTISKFISPAGTTAGATVEIQDKSKPSWMVERIDIENIEVLAYLKECIEDFMKETNKPTS